MLLLPSMKKTRRVSSMEYEVLIGLETHVELNTKTKVFCGCINEFGGIPNTHCCPICTGMPGSLPRLNRSAVEKTIMAGLATNCKINNKFAFERKNYFYPDLPKAYQVSQSTTPICVEGYVEVHDKNGNLKKIRINRIHLEEDAGKLVHALGETYVDYNRGGVPLIETVTEPDLSSTEEVLEYLNFLKNTFKHIGVSDCKMEQGSLRCDVNISLRPVGSKKYGKRTEMKNLNSFKAIERAIRFEVERQRNIYLSGGNVVQETLRWDDERAENFPMRSKEDAQDYRYFPEPDILPTYIPEEKVEEIRRGMPMLPREIKALLMREYLLSDYDAELIARNDDVYKLFSETVKLYNNPKKITNWITSEVNKRLNLVVEEDVQIPVSADNLAKLLKVYEKGEVSQQGARTIFEVLWDNVGNESVEDIVSRLGLKLESNDDELEKIIERIVADNPKAVSDFRSGNQKAFAFFVGQTMKATRGQADAGKINTILRKYLEG